MAGTITIPCDPEIERALDKLTRDGAPRSTVVREAILELAARRQRAEMRRTALRMPLGEQDGITIADELAAPRRQEC